MASMRALFFFVAFAPALVSSAKPPKGAGSVVRVQTSDEDARGQQNERGVGKRAALIRREALDEDARGQQEGDGFSKGAALMRAGAPDKDAPVQKKKGGKNHAPIIRAKALDKHAPVQEQTKDGKKRTPLVRVEALDKYAPAKKTEKGPEKQMKKYMFEGKCGIRCYRPCAACLKKKVSKSEFRQFTLENNSTAVLLAQKCPEDCGQVLTAIDNCFQWLFATAYDLQAAGPKSNSHVKDKYVPTFAPMGGKNKECGDTSCAKCLGEHGEVAREMYPRSLQNMTVKKYKAWCPVQCGPLIGTVEGWLSKVEKKAYS